MAIIYKKTNPLQKKSRRYLTAGICFAIPLLLYMLAFFLYRFHFAGFYHLLPIVLFGWPAALLVQKYKTLEAGLNGEKAALCTLSNLSDDYYVFTTVCSEFEGKKGEVDCLVVGRNGLFVIEVKNHNGKICAAESGEYWEQHKVGQEGGRYSKRIKNPLKQTKRNVYILSQNLKSNGIRVWIEGLVYFTNKKVEIDYLPDGCYQSGEEINNYITSYSPRYNLSQDELKKVVNLLLGEHNHSK